MRVNLSALPKAYLPPWHFVDSDALALPKPSLSFLGEAGGGTCEQANTSVIGQEYVPA